MYLSYSKSSIVIIQEIVRNWKAARPRKYWKVSEFESVSQKTYEVEKVEAEKILEYKFQINWKLSCFVHQSYYFQDTYLRELVNCCKSSLDVCGAVCGSDVKSHLFKVAVTCLALSSAAELKAEARSESRNIYLKSKNKKCQRNKQYILSRVKFSPLIQIYISFK